MVDLVRNIYEIFEIVAVVFLFLIVGGAIVALSDPSYTYSSILSTQVHHLSHTHSDDSSMEINLESTEDISLIHQENQLRIGVTGGVKLDSNVSSHVNIEETESGLVIN